MSAANPVYDNIADALHEARACLDLPTAFEFIEKYDKEENYARCTIFVYHALALAAHKGLACGIRFGLARGIRCDGDEEEAKKWPIVVIQLPGQGEVAWHCAAYPGAYDGHSTEEKYKRIARYVEQYKK